MMKTQKSALYDQTKLKLLSDQLCDRIEDLLEVLEIDDYRISEKMIIMNCPIHGGDNDSAFNLYHTGDSYRGNWKCRTHQCEEIFKGSIIGFIRGLLSSKKYGWQNKTDKTCTFREALMFSENFVGNKIDDIKIDTQEKEKNNFVNSIKLLKKNKPETNNWIPREIAAKSLNIPSPYFIKRGFHFDILKRYDVGNCENPNKPMYGRAVVPIYDMDYKYMVGCTGRSIYSKCNSCGCYHTDECPQQDKRYLYSKWKHSYGFKTQNYLYNLWFAREHIKTMRSVILVESPGNVWRLEEAGIHNSLAIFGSSLAETQKMLLDISGAMTIYTIMDNDEAGEKAAKNIYDKCNRTYNVHNIDINYEDIASMSRDQVIEEILPRINK